MHRHANLDHRHLKELFGYLPDENMPYEAAVDQIEESHRQQVIQAVEASITKGEAYDLEYPILGYQSPKGALE